MRDRGGGLSFKLHLHQFNICRLQKVHCVFVGAVGAVINDARNAGIDQHLGAIDARQVSDVAHCAFGGNAVQCGLNDGVRLGVDRADAMTIHHEMPDLVAMLLPGGGAVEARGQDAFFQHQHTAHEGAVTGAALGYGIGDLHEIRIPIRAHGSSVGLCHCEGALVFRPKQSPNDAEVAWSGRTSALLATT